MAGPEPTRARTILFVDDEEKSRKYFGRIFGEDFRVLTAEDGEAALATFQARRSEIGVIVTDQIMPGMPGLRLLSAVEEAGPEVVRILSTAYADSEDVAAAAKRGLIESFIIKPWDIEEVEAILHQAAARFADGDRPRTGPA